MSRTLALGLASLVLLVGLSGCSPMGEKITNNNGEVYYKDGVTKQEAEKLGEYLTKEKFFDGERKTVQLTKKDSKYQFRVVFKPEHQNNAEAKWGMQIIAGRVSREVLDGAEVELQLCDDHLKTVSTAEAVDFGPMLTFNNGQVFYKDDVTKEEAEKLGNFLIKDKYFEGTPKSIQLAQKDKKYQLRVVFKPEYQNNAEFKWGMQVLAGRVSREVLDGKGVELQVCDDHFKAISTAEAIDFGPMLTFNKGQLFYRGDVTEEEAEKLGEFLVKEKYFDGSQKTIQLTKKDKKYQFRMVVDPSKIEGMEEIFKRMGKEISQRVLKGAAIEVHLCDDHFKTLKVINP